MSAAVVVGSGPNGLAAAIRLAHAGLRVTVVEAADRPGGGARTAELTLPGLRHDECSAVHPTAVASPYFAALDLGRHGLRWCWPDVDLAHPLDDGRAGVAARDPDATAESLGADHRRWRRLFAPVLDDFERVIGEALGPPLHLPRHPLALARFGLRAAVPATWVARVFADEPARALFIGLAAHKFGRLDTPLSTAVGAMFVGTAHTVGWPVAAGGSGAITDALVAELTDHGGRVVTATTVHDLGELTEIAGATPAVVMFDTAAHAALRIAGDRLPPRLRRTLGRFSYGPAAFKVDFAIDGDIPWTNPQCRRAGTVHLGGTAAQIAHAEEQTARGVMPERPFALLGQQYLCDPSRSQGTANPIYAYAHVPHGYSGDATSAVIAQIERFAPGFTDRILATASRGPAELERHNANYVGGDICAGANTVTQLLFRPRFAANPYRLAGGLYLCSSATPPGAGVHGMNGFHAAETALADLRRR